MTGRRGFYPPYCSGVCPAGKMCPAGTSQPEDCTEGKYCQSGNIGVADGLCTVGNTLLIG